MIQTIARFFWLFLVLGVLFYSCSKDSVGDPTPNPMEEEDDNMGMEDSDTTTAIVWTGDNITFSKANGADPTDSANQDRLTDNVWITRGNNGGQIFNIRSETSANKSLSPAGTEWAEGQLSDYENLTFRPFRAAVGNPKGVVGKDLVLHLIDDDIYLQVRFTNWAQAKGGGFAYQRSTPQ